jgi:hypothetical protein
VKKVGIGCIAVKKEGVSAQARLLLQRQGNEISKSSFWQGILVREKPVAGVEADSRTSVAGIASSKKNRHAPRSPSVIVPMRPEWKTGGMCQEKRMYPPSSFPCQNPPPEKSMFHRAALDKRQ